MAVNVLMEPFSVLEANDCIRLISMFMRSFLFKCKTTYSNYFILKMFYDRPVHFVIQISYICVYALIVIH